MRKLIKFYGLRNANSLRLLLPQTHLSHRWGNKVINFTYTAGGTPLGFTYNGTPYFYLLNLQGDIVCIYDSTGEIVVNYTYDTWGKLISITGSMADTIGVKNPLRYRGYYYDTETSLYYLQSERRSISKDNVFDMHIKRAFGCVDVEKGSGSAGGGNISLPKNDSQLKHIFAERDGHVPDTPQNRKKLIELAKDQSKYLGKDKHGNSWHAEITGDGKQWWVRFREQTINEGGLNQYPRPWDPESGLNKNPFK